MNISGIIVSFRVCLTQVVFEMNSGFKNSAKKIMIRLSSLEQKIKSDVVKQRN